MIDFIDPEWESIDEDRWVAPVEFTGEEPFFRDHFPGYPIVPGVLLLECLRDAAERGWRETGGPVRCLEISRARFIQPVIPPAKLKAVVVRDPKREFGVKGEITDSEGNRLATAQLLLQPMEAPESP